MFLLQELIKALVYAFDMFWEVLWPLSLGFLLSAIVQSVVAKGCGVSKVRSPCSLALGCVSGLGRRTRVADRRAEEPICPLLGELPRPSQTS